MDHQDWKTYIVHCKDTPKTTGNGQMETVKRSTNFDKSKKYDQKIEEGDLKHKKIDPELSKKIQQGRLSKGWTQKQLATKLSIPVNVINEMECGKYLYNGQTISKVKRALNIK